MRNEPEPGSPTAGLKIVKRASAKYPGTCCLVDEHPIAKGSRIVRVVPVEGVGRPEMELGWACSTCQDRIARGI